MIKILLKKNLDLLDEIPEDIAASMNKGDIFLPKGHGWAYRIEEKVYHLDDDLLVYNNERKYTFHIIVKKL